jgi:Fe2+ transport system protein FeoA
MKKISLIQMKAGQKGKVAEVRGGPVLQHRLMGMGIYLGKDITKLSQFVLRGPIAIKAGRTVAALGYSMAVKVIVEVE